MNAARRTVGKHLAALTLTLLAGCAVAPSAPPRPHRNAIAAFVLEGRLSIRQGDKPYASNIEWQHTPDGDRIFLCGPLGQGIAELSRDATGATLLTADRRTVKAADWSSLAEALLGIRLPLSGAVRWITGDVQPTLLDAVGRPRRALDQGWIIDYLEYESPHADALPASMEFQREDIEVRLRVGQWQVGTP